MEETGKKPTNAGTKKPDGVVQLLVYEDTFEVQMTESIDVLTLASLLYATLEYIEFSIGSIDKPDEMMLQ